MRRASRTDAPHAAIREALRQCGCLVHDTSGVGNGFPDLVVLPRAPGLRNVLFLEVKTARGRILEAQASFMAQGWPCFVVRSVEDALKIVGARHPTLK